MSDETSKTRNGASRRRFVGGGVATLAALPVLGATGALAQAPALPKSPIALSIIDVGGALALMQKAFEDYRTANPKLVSRIAFVKAPAPELASKIKAQQEAGRADLDLVLTGSDGLAATTSNPADSTTNAPVRPARGGTRSATKPSPPRMTSRLRPNVVSSQLPWPKRSSASEVKTMGRSAVPSAINCAGPTVNSMRPS